MQRILTSYENNMRPEAFQCCTSQTAEGSFVTGFRMLHVEVPNNADIPALDFSSISDIPDFSEFLGPDRSPDSSPAQPIPSVFSGYKRATTGCIGSCSSQCGEEVQLEYDLTDNAMEFIFDTMMDENDIERILEIYIQGEPICDQAARP